MPVILPSFSPYNLQFFSLRVKLLGLLLLHSILALTIVVSALLAELLLFLFPFLVSFLFVLELCT